MSIPRPPDRPMLDPREAPDFHAEFHPTANGKPAPLPGASEPHDRLALDFLAAYYEINRGYAHLLAIRAERPSERRPDRERAALQAIEIALRNRDELEDFYAPYGIIAEPVLQEGIAVDVRFTFGDVDSAGHKRNQPHFSSTFITIPLPPGVKLNGRKPPVIR
jgi:hypothetical protein